MLNEKQAIKFWNAIQQGEIINSIPDTDHQQGYEICKPTYTSSLCEHFELPYLYEPRVNYGYMGQINGTYNPNDSDTGKVASFLRDLADAIERASTVDLTSKLEG